MYHNIAIKHLFYLESNNLMATLKKLFEAP